MHFQCIVVELARTLAPAMIAAGHGAIMVTGNTSSLRGIPSYAVFAPTKAAQRIFAQSLARDLGPKGVHVAYITTDAAINAPWLGNDDQKPTWLKPPLDWKKNRMIILQNLKPLRKRFSILRTKIVLRGLSTISYVLMLKRGE